ncbi:MAG: hypothetical protein AB7V39_03710 [Nitrospiraceae bacterium]
MFYRWREPSNILMMTDLANAFLGQTLFIIGGHPSINDMPLGLLNQPGILTMALNNATYAFPKPTFWLTADKPNCYSGHSFHRADIIKFSRLDTSLEHPNGSARELRTFPNLYFYEVAPDRYTPSNFFTEGVPLVWWKSVFPIALQLAWRLGFRQIYLVGCAFWSTKDSHYAWASQLTNAQRAYSQVTYNEDVERLATLTPFFGAAGLEVVSCTENSRANAMLRYEPLGEAVRKTLLKIPDPTPLGLLRHSSTNA